ncbi:hypothetical protein EDD18DRAFT_420894 [Armillaria luteobubalina]|uniref:Peroxidase n=1 Tax=Armillaria luteobubalina TaxID=153913 RepID=A0AA39Q0N4_9AGAR|nr:hypothetical protein EDD18DRAFT_420894 [Armillaria luteobubalina]
MTLRILFRFRQCPRTYTVNPNYAFKDAAQLTPSGGLHSSERCPSLGGCSSPTIRIPLRVGRIDATEGGELGVPEPESNLEEILAISAKTGFNQPDLIALTVCGHTTGSVHQAGFPQVGRLLLSVTISRPLMVPFYY